MSPPRFLRFLLALLSSLALAAFSSAQTAPPIRIMPLGDSITDGSSYDSPDGTGGYRGPLFNALTSAGYNVDSIGSLTVNSGLLTEKEHEGHSGWRIDQLDTNMIGWLASYADPDVVLMHIGTNDFGQNNNIATAIDRLDALILKIATQRPYAHIIVTNLMERNEPYNGNIQSLFNPYVQDRVNAHAAAGRRVTFLDMRSACPVTEMPIDQLHPSQPGYNKMAAAWLPAIQAVIGPNGDGFAPEIARARGTTDRTHVAITFSKPVADAAASAANYALSGGLTLSAASLDPTKRIVTLTTNEQAPGTTYSVTVNGVQDRIATPNTIAANSAKTFSATIPRGYLNNVPESAGYTLACSLDVPAVANYLSVAPAYTLDNRPGIGPFTRVAYYVELQSAAGDLQYLWASMDAFTNDVSKIAVPTVASGAIFQQSVANMNVVSNVAGIVNGTGLAGNLEFWPGNYDATNSVPVAGASDTLYDFGDTRTAGTYGSMQLHNAAAAQTLFAFNNWGGSATTQNVDLGIGNQPGTNPDWTFAQNGGNYTIKTIQVLVQTTGDVTAPSVVSSVASFGRTSVKVTFSEPLAAASVRAENFALNGGVTVLGVALAANQREVILTTTTQPVGTPLALTISGVRDSSPNANRIATGSTIAVAAPVLPPEIVANVGTPANGYQLVYSLDVPVIGNLNALGAGAYSVNDSAFSAPFTRVAYYLELQKPGAASDYVWVSMDAFTANRGRIGVPTAATGAFFQRNVTSMDVISNVAGVATGTGIATGSLEFWPSSYANAKAAASPANASDAIFDFGDSGASTTAGYGSMQVHNYGAAQTVFALNHFGLDGVTMEAGIGNNPSASATSAGQQKDWTFSNNAAAYSRRVLHVLVLPGATTAPAISAKVPEAANYQLVYSLDLPTTGNLVSGAGFTGYTVNNSADVGAFTRVAYYMELQKTGDASPRYVWTSMDAFTANAALLGVPTPASGAIFQQAVSNLNVASNVAGVVTGASISTGNIEFWPNDYTAVAPAGLLPGNPGSTSLFDFNDTRKTTGTHGSMQVHNFGASQTLFALNNWGTAANTANVLAMGIGNNPTGGQNPDYTLSNNGTSWDIKRVLHVFVLPGSSDTAAPTITRATGSTTLNRLVVTFSEPVADGAAAVANFAINNGLSVTGATLLAGNREVALTTSAQTAGTIYTVTATGIRDRSPNGNLIAAGATATFTAYTPPAVLGNVVEIADYKLIHRLAIPSTSGRWNVNAIPYSVDESKYGEQVFDRVAYLLELDGNWAYASFDPFTTSLGKVGLPTLGVTGTAFQQKVTHMNVASNVGSIVTGTDLATGNIEFWGGNYSAANGLSIPNASASTLDFGDTMSAGTFACLQVHNFDLDGDGAGITGQTILAYNNWGSNVATSDLGIGNNPNAGSVGTGGTQAPDWTYSAGSAAYSTRNLYVLVRPGGTPIGAAPQLLSQPASRRVAANGSATLAVTVNGSGPFMYQWRRNGVAIPGATNPWLDLANFGSAQAGTYDVVVSSATLASTTSQPATVALANVNPIFSGFAFTVTKNEAASVLRSQLLAKATDADGDTLSITAASAASQQGGTVALDANAAIYTPATGFIGADNFTITVADGQGGSVVGTVNVTVTAAALSPVRQSTAARRADGKLDVLFFGTPGQSSLIERSLDFASWTTLQTLTPGDDGLLPFTDPTPPVGKAFYRTRVAVP